MSKPTPEQHEMMRARMDLAVGGLTSVANGLLTKVHLPGECAGKHCWVHNPSQHPMATWPVRWRNDKMTAERVCEHGVGHPDPDDLEYNQQQRRDVSVHGCDGCCGYHRAAHGSGASRKRRYSGD